MSMNMAKNGLSIFCNDIFNKSKKDTSENIQGGTCQIDSFSLAFYFSVTLYVLSRKQNPD